MMDDSNDPAVAELERRLAESELCAAHCGNMEGEGRHSRHDGSPCSYHTGSCDEPVWCPCGCPDAARAETDEQGKRNGGTESAAPQ